MKKLTICRYALIRSLPKTSPFFLSTIITLLVALPFFGLNLLKWVFILPIQAIEEAPISFCDFLDLLTLENFYIVLAQNITICEIIKWHLISILLALAPFQVLLVGAKGGSTAKGVFCLFNTSAVNEYVKNYEV